MTRGIFPPDHQKNVTEEYLTLETACYFSHLRGRNGRGLGSTGLREPAEPHGDLAVQQTGLNGNSTATITLTQSGNGFVGKNAANGNGFTGTFVNDTQINGKWHGPGGAGWLTVYVSPNGHSFNGTWGYNGRPPTARSSATSTPAVADYRRR